MNNIIIPIFTWQRTNVFPFNILLTYRLTRNVKRSGVEPVPPKKDSIFYKVIDIRN